MNGALHFVPWININGICNFVYLAVILVFDSQL